MLRPIGSCGGVLMVLASSLAGCGAAGGGDDATGRAVADITVVPPNVACVRITVRGVTQGFDVTPAASAHVLVGPLSSGTALVSAQAYNAACSAVTASSTPTWVSDPTSVTIVAGVDTDIAITLHPNTLNDVSFDFVNPVRSVALGLGGFALMRDGSVWHWGGDDGTDRVPPAAPVPGLSSIQKIVAGALHACALFSDHTLVCWGVNTLGQLGDGTTTSSLTPVPVAGGARWADVVAGRDHTCAIRDDGARSLYCWGSNNAGQILGATGTTVPTPRQVSSGIRAVFAGTDVTCMQPGDGRLLCKGDLRSGRAGIGILSGSETNLRLSEYTPPDVFSIGPSSSCGAGGDGRLLCAGTLLGATGTPSTAWDPVEIGAYDVVDVSVGSNVACALRRDGTVWCWGNNFNGALGNGTVVNSTYPTQVLGLTNVTGVSCGDNRCCAVRSDGTAWCWGSNYRGDLGDGTRFDRTTPVRVAL